MILVALDTDTTTLSIFAGVVLLTDAVCCIVVVWGGGTDLGHGWK